ncbi:DUF805 domain-containing protein [Paenibacillus athensensis]|uniref:DUF805 domain-containing protein n=1 Tax=Paenibacillus athensensis TaxID=1967502 RepID=A0A4Y8Q4Q1_9BACL|nr:DUF805 domain-containing protein [Paenibacillus athensensis]MCD1260776.1 DUF805 domain-containing protein [Paenibacillus athensensis]
MRWYVSVLKNYAVFDGRARRQEFWMFTLIQGIIGIIFGIGYTIGFVMLSASAFSEASEYNPSGLPDFSGAGSLGAVLILGIVGLLNMAYSLATLLPTLAVSARRLHDTGRSGWWQLIGLVPFVGGILLLVFYCLDSEGNNPYGPNPKY